jgi:hypothetical protein
MSVTLLLYIPPGTPPKPEVIMALRTTFKLDSIIHVSMHHHLMASSVQTRVWLFRQSERQVEMVGEMAGSKLAGASMAYSELVTDTCAWAE